MQQEHERHVDDGDVDADELRDSAEAAVRDRRVLQSLRVLDTRIEAVTEQHKTPWVSQWTLHTVEIPDEAAAVLAEQLSQALEATQAGSWYADFKNQTTHYIIFRNRVFRIDRHSPQAYEVPRQYGMALGIPEYQLDFSPNVA